MGQFHFHVLDGTALADTAGTELRDIAAAKLEAIKLAGGLLKDGFADDDIWQGKPWQIVVNDSPLPNSGRAFFVLTLTASE